MIRHTMILLLGAGLLAGCSRGVQTASEQFNELPPQAQKTIRAQDPNAEIASISHITTNSMDAYKVEFRNANGRNPVVIVAANGTLLSSELGRPAGTIQRALTPTGAAGTPLSALPEAVQKTIQAKAPNAEVSNIAREEDNGRVIYKIEFKEPGKNPTMKVAEDGSLVQDLQK